jgi:hypothetical protein
LRGSPSPSWRDRGLRYRQDKVTDMARRTSSELTGDEKTKDEFLLATKDRRIFPEAYGFP